MEKKSTIYAHDLAAEIIERFEDVLERYNITVPSPEDDEKDADNGARLYGSVYRELADDIETILIEIAEDVKRGCDVVTDKFSGSM